MNEDMTFCKNKDCEITKCNRNPKNIKVFNIYHSFANLEGNPLYCQKQNFNGYQYVKTEEQVND